MKKWEYKTHGIKRFADIDEFNQLGEEGWELVSVMQNTTIGGIKGIFKRELLDEPKKELITD